MIKNNLIKDVEIVDETSFSDDPYHDWKIHPGDKFVEELVSAGFTLKEVYDIDLYGERGILVDYELLPKERLKYDEKLKVVKLRMMYPSFYEYKHVLDELCIMYDENYWLHPEK